MKPLIEQPEGSRRWLEGLPQDTQSWASNLFLAAIRAGASTPREVCRHAAQATKARHDEAEAENDAQSVAKLLRIWRHLIDQPQSAMAFAVDRLAWEQLSDEEKRQCKAENAARYRAQWQRERR